MKKIFCFISSIICILCFFCACKTKHIPPQIDQYLSVALPVSYFNSETDVTVTVSIGFPETFVSRIKDNVKAVLVVSQNLRTTNDITGDIILNTITDFTPYIWEEENNKIIYKSTQEYIIPQSVFVENSGKVYCSLYIGRIEMENYKEEAGSSMAFSILYEKDENGIKLELMKKHN